jgi:hypothetical protein
VNITSKDGKREVSLSKPGLLAIEKARGILHELGDLAKDGDASEAAVAIRNLQKRYPVPAAATKAPAGAA